MMEFVDTHCHIHFKDYKLDPEQVMIDAASKGVTRLIVVGCTLDDSKEAVKFAAKYKNVWASIGMHPHEAAKYVNDEKALKEFSLLASSPKVVAIGETGLDYYYEHSPKADQLIILRFQLELAAKHNLPLIFHVRDAFDDFWPVYDSFLVGDKSPRGVIHSFTSDIHNLKQILSRGLYVGLNGIMTFTTREDQLEAAKRVPLSNLVLETDAPFLTPAPFRGKIGESKYVRVTGEFLAKLRGDSLEDLAKSTTSNAICLFNLV